jgi:hypothetical protein
MGPDRDDAGTKQATKRPWERPRLTYEGSTAELIQGGGGKSAAGGDPGDMFKEKPH